MRQVSLRGQELIMAFEGYSPRPYHDAAGQPTIGYGHLITPGEVFPEALSRECAMQLLLQDIKIAESAVLRLIHVPLSAGQFGALVSFTFNLGAGALQRSTLRRKVSREQHGDVAQEFRRWVWAGGRRLKGLIRRREAEIALYYA